MRRPRQRPADRCARYRQGSVPVHPGSGAFRRLHPQQQAARNRLEKKASKTCSRLKPSTVPQGHRSRDSLFKPRQHPRMQVERFARSVLDCVRFHRRHPRATVRPMPLMPRTLAPAAQTTPSPQPEILRFDPALECAHRPRNKDREGRRHLQVHRRSYVARGPSVDLRRGRRQDLCRIVRWHRAASARQVWRLHQPTRRTRISAPTPW